MLLSLLYIVVGAVAGHLVALYAAKVPDRTFRVFAQALVIAAFIYVAFAMASMETGWLGIEIAGVAIFLAFASLGLKRSLTWLWLGWALHIFWDVGLHLVVDAPFVPIWYPMACIGFDAVVALHVFRAHRNEAIAAPESA